MRVAALLVAMIGFAVGPLAIRSASAGPDRIVLEHPSNFVQVAEGCGVGRHWVGGHRAPGGRWIPGHCAPN